MPTQKKRLTSKATGIKHGFRSGLEEKVAVQLQDAGKDFRYEQPEDRVYYTKPARKCRYTPDFVLTKTDGTALVVETKGRFLTADRQKHLLIKEQNPELDIRFVFSNPNQHISKQSKTTYAAWCIKHGYKFAARTIPAEWLEE